MSVERLDLNLLKVFDVIYNERNLTRAAEVLHITQPAVSNSLQRLRENLNDPLFIRERRGVVPTPFADSLAPNVQAALRLIREGLSVIDAFDPAISERTFRVSMNDPIEALFLPSMLKDMTKSAPNINILSSYVGRYELAKELASGAVDIAIDVPVPPDDRCCCTQLIEESYVCLLRQGHPATQEKLTLKRYLELKHIHVSARRHGIGYVDRALLDYGVKREIKARTRNQELAVEIVRNTDYVITVPEHFLAQYNLAVLTPQFLIPPLEWWLYWPQRLENDAANRWLRQHIIELSGRLAAK